MQPPVAFIYFIVVEQQIPSYPFSGGLYGSSMPMGMYGMNMNSNMYQANYGISSDQGKGKGKEADFEAAFARAAASFAPTQVGTSRIVEVGDSVTDLEEGLESATLGGDTKGDDRGEFKE